MTNSILIKNLKSLTKTMDNAINFVDIDYEVTNPRDDGKNARWSTKTRDTVMRNERAVANAYRMWLQSGLYDYIRQPGFGGFFSSQLNDKFPFDPMYENDVAQALIQASKETWTDIDIVGCEVKCVPEKRTWRVRVSIMDANTRLVALSEPTQLEADINVD